MDDSVKVVIVKEMNGKQFPWIVHGKYALPVCMWLNCYLNNNHKNRLTQEKKKGIGRKKRGSESTNLPLNTLKAYAQELKFIWCYFTPRNIDLVERVADGEILSIEEIEAFVRAAKMPFEALNQTAISNVISITDKRLEQAIHATNSSSPSVSAHTCKQRLFRLKSYVEYLYITHFHDKELTDEEAKASNKFHTFQVHIDKWISDIRAENVDTSDPLESVLPTEKYFDLLDVIQMSSPRNPFKGSKLRNQLIMQIFIETGVRVGAVMKLKISDLRDDWANPRFLLTRTPNDIEDTRLDRGTNKTKALSVSISRELMNRILLYIDTVRASHEASYKHDFLFISEKGATSGGPLTRTQISKMVDKLGQTINFKIHPHLLRHKWNEIFTDKAEAVGYDSAQIEDLRKYCMGWSEKSEMASLYNSFKNASKVSELSAANQNKSVPSLGESNES